MKRLLLILAIALSGWQSQASKASFLESVFSELGIASKATPTLESLTTSSKVSPELESFSKLGAEEQRAHIQNQYGLLAAQAKLVKLCDAKYFAPWEPGAKRIDWQAKNVVLEIGKPLSASEIAKALNVKQDVVVKMLVKDQGNDRKVFFLMRNGKFWVSSSKLP